jgi:hypothetical protein
MERNERKSEVERRTKERPASPREIGPTEIEELAGRPSIRELYDRVSFAS